MKRLKKMIQKLVSMIILVLMLYLTLMIVKPEKITSHLNYQFYTVLTNSMEPKIPTYSLVLVKKFETDEDIQLHPQQIITFHADRFGQRIIITHHFNKTERTDEGITIYRTNAEGKDQLDIYQTTREDLIGTYLFHIPYIGKIVLFLKSKFGFILYGEFLSIFLINALIKSRWEEEAQRHDE